ncbi:MAG: prolyl oligopeptidase family serine peptidase [Bacteroidales bacterium]|nr:prolyl oligopeptidase family serine peptidase [Bacteroidales bacterium]
MHKQTLLLVVFMLSMLQSTAADHMTTHNLFDLKTVVEVAPSPDQNYIAFTLNVPRPFTHDAGVDYRELYLYDVQRDEIIPFMTGNRRIFNIGWSPNGDAVTFRANLDENPFIQVYSLSLRGGEARAVTQHTSSVLSYAFIDEETLAIVATSPQDPLREELRRKGYRIEVYEEEWVHRNIYTYNVATHETRQLTEDMTVFEFVLSNNGRYAAAAIAPRNLVDDSYMFKRIHIVDLQSGHTELIMENPGKLGNMAFSPDDSKLAFRAASKMEDSVVGSLFVIDLETDKNKAFEDLRNYVEGMELSVIDFAWKDNQTLLYAAEEGVDIVLSLQPLDEEDRSIIIEPETIVFRGFHYDSGRVTLAAHTHEHPAELFTFDMEDHLLTRHTDHNTWLSDIRLAKQRKVTYYARDDQDIEGVLVYPLDYVEGNRYPLIVYIHGGPEAAVQNGWVTAYSIWGQIAAARGYFVFMPNYRASSGRGVDFTMAGYGDLVGVEYDDVIDGIDHLINIGYVDIDRVGIGGGSYGGYFSAWSATRHTDRFAASVMFVGISNQISKRNTTDIPWEDYMVHWGYWTHENWEDVYSRSPVKYARQSLTPTLILHGDADPRVHPSQSLEMYRALKLHGRAPVRLIWYQNEGHGNARNVHRLDYIVRTMEWFDYYLRLDKPRDQMPDKYPDILFE